MDVYTKQQRIAQLAVEKPEVSFTSLNHYLDMNWMKEAYHRLRRDSAPGVDGQTVEAYGRNLEENLQSLLARAKSGRYHAPPVKRVHIPKGDGKETRPIGIPTVEDKLLQRAILMLLEPIYEQEFKEFSFGFRTGRSPHDALHYLRTQGMANQVNWVIDVDIQRYFDTLGHAKLREFLRQRVQDGVITRLIGKWLKAGVLEEGMVHYCPEGTPQGGVISPILSNIYLHEVLDKWFETEVKPRLKGRAVVVRFADDFVLGFEFEEDARRVYEVLPKRFEKHGLRLHPTKTRLIRFERPCAKQRSRAEDDGEGGRDTGGNDTFDFLGFTHYWGKTRKGWYTVKRKTARKRLSRSLKALNQWLRAHLHLSVPEQWTTLVRKLRGTFNYYGITGNSERLNQHRRAATRLWHQWLNRRSRKRSLTWERFNVLLERYPLPAARIGHYC